MIQVKISKDINKYESKTFWGFSPRQLGFTILAIIIALIINFVLIFIPEDLRGFLTMAVAIPCIGCGWINIQGMKFEKYVYLFLKSNFSNKKRLFINENLYDYIPANKKKRKGKHSKRS